MDNYTTYLTVTHTTVYSSITPPAFTIKSASESLLFYDVVITYKINNTTHTTKLNIGGSGKSIDSRDKATILNITGKVKIPI